MTGQKCLVSKSYTISVPLIDQRLLSVGPIDVTFLRQNDFSMQCFYSQMHFTFFFPQNCPFKKKFNLGERDNVACFPRFFKIQLKWLFTCFLMKYTSFRNGKKGCMQIRHTTTSYKKMLAKESKSKKKVQIKKLLF